MSGVIFITDYNPDWPALFDREAARIRTALGRLTLGVEHVGSTSVPGLAAKPIIDILLVVEDSADEDAYKSTLEMAGYILNRRERDWYQHRLFKGSDPVVNLHVFSSGCPEIQRMIQFRDWLRCNPADRDLYAATKLALARNKWKSVQAYADAKTPIVVEILARATAGSANSKVSS